MNRLTLTTPERSASSPAVSPWRMRRRAPIQPGTRQLTSQSQHRLHSRAETRLMPSLHASEEAYLTSLQDCILFYVHPFYESELLPEEVMHQLPAFVEMHTLSQNLSQLQCPTQVIDGVAYLMIGAAFWDLMPRLRVYGTYCSKVKLGTLRNLIATDSRIRALVKATETSAMEPRLVTSTMRFFECLYQPFKRLKEYRAFLNSAVDAVTQGIDPENTVETIRAVQRHPDYGNRRMVLEEIEQMLSTCEENDAEFLEFFQIEHIENSIANFPKSFVLCSPKRKLIKEGPVTLQRKGRQRSKQLHFFLFSDVIVYCASSTPSASSSSSTNLLASSASSSSSSSSAASSPSSSLSSSTSSNLGAASMSSSSSSSSLPSFVPTASSPIVFIDRATQSPPIATSPTGAILAASPPRSHLPLDLLHSLTPGKFVYKGVMWLTSAQVSLTGVSSNRQFFLSARVGDKQKTYAVTIDTAEARQEWVAGIQGSICKLKGITSPEPLQDTPETNAAENARRAGGGGGGGGGGTGGGGGGNNSGAGGSGGNNANSTGQDPPQLQRTATPLSPIGISRTCLNERPPASVVTISFDREGHTRIRTSGMSNKGAVDLSIELLELLLQLLRKYAKISKRSMAEALDRAGQDPLFATFQSRIRELHYLRDLHELDNDGRIAFFLNIYNTLSLHMLILYHAQMRDLSSLGMLTRWQRKVSYIIGGSVMSGSSAGVKSPFIKDLGGELSLYEIEFSILRSGLSAMRTNEPEAQCSHEFSASDPRYPLRVVAPNLINFAICWNTSSSPTIRVYTRENLMNELRTNTSSFCRARCRLYTHSPPKKVVLPQLFDWFFSDFGGTIEELVIFLKYYLPRDIQETIATTVLPEMHEIVITFDEHSKNLRYPVGSILAAEEIEERCLVLEKGGLERYYSFPLPDGQEVLVHECLYETDFGFVVPHEYLKIILPDRKAELAGSKLDPVFAERRRAHLQLLEGMHELYNDYRGTYRGLTFRPSTYKKDPFFQCVAINLHSQIMSVTIPDRPISRTFEVTTFGAPAAHYYKFKMGLRQLVQAREALDPNTTDALKRAEYEDLDLQISQRIDLCLPQLLSAVVTSFVTRLELYIDNQTLLRQYETVGFLAQFESLLSTHGSEMGMLGDMAHVITLLHQFSFQLVKFSSWFTGNVNSNKCVRMVKMIRQAPLLDVAAPIFPAPESEQPRFIIQLGVTEPFFDKLPKGLQIGSLISLHGVLFTQGINEQQSVAIRLGNESKLQEDINTENFMAIALYLQKFSEFQFTGGQNEEFRLELGKDCARIGDIVRTSRNEKNVDILPLTADFARKLNAGRLTSCKSAKDRTSMSVTWEQARLLQKHFNMAPDLVTQCTEQMRVIGVRRENAFKNIGKRQYAFNALQRQLLPEVYRNPKGTGGSTVT